MELEKAQVIANGVKAKQGQRLSQKDYQREYRLLNRDRLNARRRELRHNNRLQENKQRARWRARHPDSVKRNDARYWDRVKSVWGSSGARPPREIYERAERYAHTTILPLLGFTNIVRFDHDPGFTFDILAERDRKVFIDVTTAAKRYMGKKLRLARILGFPFFVLFISPNLKFYYLQDMTNSIHGWAHVPASVLRTFIAKEGEYAIS